MKPADKWLHASIAMFGLSLIFMCFNMGRTFFEIWQAAKLIFLGALLSAWWHEKKHSPKVDYGEMHRIYRRGVTGVCGECGRSLGRWVDAETSLPVAAPVNSSDHVNSGEQKAPKPLPVGEIELLKRSDDSRN